MPGIDTENFEKVEVHSAADLRQWLHTHHGRTDAVWLVTWKKVRPDRYVSTGEVLDDLLAALKPNAAAFAFFMDGRRVF